MADPTYQGIHNYEPIDQGDTLRGRSFTFNATYGTNPTVLALSLLEASLVVYTCNGKGSFEIPVTVAGNVVTQPDVPETVTETWPVGEHVYKLTVKRTDGAVVRKHVTGTLEICAKHE